MQIILQLIASFLLALSISLYAVPIIVNVVHKLNLFDKPTERSAAIKPVPTLGGIAIFISFVLASTIGMSGYEISELVYIIVAAVLIFFVGLKDDVVSLSPRKKIIAEIIAASILIFLADIRFTNLHGLLGFWEIGIVPSFLIICYIFILVIKAFNLMDGIVGLAAGLSMLAAIVFGGWFFISSNYSYAILSFSLVGAIAGFFCYNVYGKKNKIFMGDTGSLLLGTIISVLMIRFNELNIDQTQPYAIASSPGVSLGIIFYPIFDTVRVTLIRIINRRSPFSADKNHLHHRLLLLGNSHKKSTYLIIGMNVIFILLVYIIRDHGPLRLMVYTTFIGSVLFMIPAFIIRRKKLIKKDDPFQQLLIPRENNEISRNKRHQNQKPEFQTMKYQTFFQKFNLW